ARGLQDRQGTAPSVAQPIVQSPDGSDIHHVDGTLPGGRGHGDGGGDAATAATRAGEDRCSEEPAPTVDAPHPPLSLTLHPPAAPSPPEASRHAVRTTVPDAAVTPGRQATG